MMRSIVLGSLCLLLTLSAQTVQAQEGTAPQPIDTLSYQKYLSIYYNALRYNDYSVARQSLYEMMAINPSNLALADTLAMLYIDQNQYSSALILTNDILSVNASDAFAMEVNGFCYEQLGFRKEALERYESLHLATDRIDILYKMAFLQFQLSKLAEASASADIIIQDDASAELTISFPVDQTRVQEIPMRASLLNLKGLIAQSQEQKEQAIELFEQALELAPEFTVAQQNLAAAQN